MSVLQQHLETLKVFWHFESKCIPAALRRNVFPTEFEFQQEKPGKTGEDFFVLHLFCFVLKFVESHAEKEYTQQTYGTYQNWAYRGQMSCKCIIILAVSRQ